MSEQTKPKPKKPKKTPYLWINKAWCKRCRICIEFCPTKVYEMDSKGYPKIAHIDKCTVCGLCSLWCPDWAIVDNPEDQKRIQATYHIKDDGTAE